VTYRTPVILSIKDIRDNYNNLHIDDKSFIKSLMRWDGFLFFLIFCLQIVQINLPTVAYIQVVVQTLSVILSGFAIGLTFSIFDRVGLLTPVEQKISKILQKQNETELLLEETARDLKGFSNYQTARLDFGFNSIFGRIEESSHPKKFVMTQGESDGRILRIIDSIGVNSVFCFMNSYIESSRYSECIRRAVERGAHVKFLLAKPTVECAPLRHRFEDCFIKDGVYEEYQSFVGHVTDRVMPLVALKNLVKKDRIDRRVRGDFDLKFYSDSLNFPMISLSEGGQTDLPQVVWTGFYGAISSEAVPYIEWRGGALEIIAIFHNLFSEKWDRADEAWK